MKRILVTGANGQIGSELVPLLRARLGNDNVLSTDVKAPEDPGDGPFEVLDATDGNALAALAAKYDVDTVFHLASLLSATGERRPDLAWKVNMDGLKHVLDLARERGLRVFWPSSIAVFGPGTPREKTPQDTILDPNTIYGVTKVSGELLCRYYHEKYGVDVRSLRYPGIISYKTRPGGGTTDYAVEVFYAAIEGGPYTCFVRPDTRLPMMYMPDAVKATLDLMDAPAEDVVIRTSYNVGAMSFSAEEVVAAIARRVPGFSCRYEPDARQRIADSWPADVDDARARQDWGWKPDYDLDAMVDDMLLHLREKLQVEAR